MITELLEQKEFYEENMKQSHEIKSLDEFYNLLKMTWTKEENDKKKQRSEKGKETENFLSGKRNKEYIRKRLKKKLKKRKNWQSKKQHLPNPEKSDGMRRRWKTEVTSDTQEAESEDLEESTVTEFSRKNKMNFLIKRPCEKEESLERKQAKQEAKEAREKSLLICLPCFASIDSKFYFC